MLEDAILGWAGMAEEVEASVQKLRSSLHAALVNSEPRKEKECWNILLELLCGGERSEHVMRWYIQDIIAALVFLGVGSVDQVVECSCSGTRWLSRPLTPSVTVVPYVSVSERRDATSLLCSIVSRNDSFSNLGTSRIIGGLFPLMGVLQDANCADEHESQTPSRATIAKALFAHQQRFAAKRAIGCVLLDTLLFGREDGLRGLLVAILLADGIERGAQVESVQHLIHLFIRNSPPTLIVSSGPGWELQTMSLDAYHKAVCVQLLGVLGRVADPSAEDGAGRATSQLQNRETVEERLHMFVVYALNAIVHLPSQSLHPKKFQDAYRLFFAANKYLFGPAFGPLLLLTPRASEDITAALRKLLGLVKGASSCASHESMLVLWEKCCPGLLACSCEIIRSIGPEWTNSAAIQVAVVRQIWNHVAQLPTRATEISAAVCAAFAQLHQAPVEAKWRVALGDACFETKETNEHLCGGVELVALFRHVPSPKLRREMFRSLCTTTQQIIFGMSSSSTSTAQRDRLVGAVHHFLVAFQAEELFDISCFDKIMEVLNVCLTLGPVLFRASASFIQQLLSLLPDYQHKSPTTSRVLVLLESTRALLDDDHRALLCHEVFGDGPEDVSVVAPNIRHLLDESIAKIHSLSGCDPSDASHDCDVLDTSAIERHLATRNFALLAVEIMTMSAEMESNWRRRRVFRSQPRVVHALLRCLLSCDDVGVLGHVVGIFARSLLLGIAKPEGWVDVLCTSILNEPVAGSKLLDVTIPRLQRGAWDTFVARLCDVQLALCDGDSEGVLCKKLDRICLESSHGRLIDVIATIPTNHSKPDFLKMSALHLVGQLSAVLFPTVSMPWVVDLATVAFRLSAEDSCKAAAAAMLSTVVMALRSKGNLEALSTVDFEGLLTIARHFSQYRGSNEHPQILSKHQRRQEDVIRLHGDMMQRQLQGLSQDALGCVEDQDNMWKRFACDSWDAQEASRRAVRRLLQR